MRIEIKSESVLKRNPQQLFSDIDGEVVMLSINNGEYYNLDRISTQIWYLLENPINFNNLIGDLMNIYEVSKDTCIKDTKYLLEEFIQKGLIEIIDE
ncbi:MAG: lasso peptide biosynthesis PqqD family chaperone [Bacteroidales bacterium]|nr:lasso peptide biosynthesis PqqD family chaperone [Bacteroidales bacterium]